MSLLNQPIKFLNQFINFRWEIDLGKIYIEIGASGGVMDRKLAWQTFTSEFESH